MVRAIESELSHLGNLLDRPKKCAVVWQQRCARGREVVYEEAQHCDPQRIDSIFTFFQVWRQALSTSWFCTVSVGVFFYTLGWVLPEKRRKIKIFSNYDNKKEVK